MPDDPIILCEGASDEAFFEKLIEIRTLGKFEIRKAQNKGGHTFFGERLNGLKDLRGIEERKAIILVRDNDDDPDEAFRDMQGHVREAGEYVVPVAPRTSSARGKYPPVSILMLPWDGQAGCLETLLYMSASAQWPSKSACVQALAQCAQIQGWQISKQSKAELRCLLSTTCENDPNVAVNWAWKRENVAAGQLIPLEHACFDPISDFLRTFG